ncbi:M48 family metallopeptidase [Noviherbaspirillum sedimenti]|uniref:Peptidase M48 n=1 Tax=Noviherbaspirillum sedimenti TaxID=2320865 RepID=A0A3A3G6N2_9BURK|nr:M48 family metallopeptidase [Noviherbaspirillum sedimenti]RJG02202.1 peptidase M48 [Noviherbaspirillum sedimenti]
MRTIAKITIALALVLASGAAAAQFGGFTIPGLGRSADKGKAPDLGSLLGNLGKALKEPTAQEEVALGQEFAATLLGAKPLLNKPGVQRYVNTLGRWLASQTERPDLPWTFGVLDDGGYNAFATPGGYVFVTKGLLDRMRSEAELAGVLAHEIGHVLKKHHLNAVKASGWTGIAGELVSAKTGDNAQVNEFVKGAVLKVFASGLDQDDEFEADRLGVVIAARAGYDPFGLPAVLQVLQGESGQDASFALMFKTHPAPAERVNRLDALMQGRFDGLPANPGRPIKERLKEFGR